MSGYRSRRGKQRCSYDLLHCLGSLWCDQDTRLHTPLLARPSRRSRRNLCRANASFQVRAVRAARFHFFRPFDNLVHANVRKSRTRRKTYRAYPWHCVCAAETSLQVALRLDNLVPVLFRLNKQCVLTAAMTMVMTMMSSGMLLLGVCARS